VGHPGPRRNTPSKTTGVLTVPSANSAGNYPVCCNPGGDTISLLLHTGNGTFAAAQTHTVGTTPFAVWAGTSMATAVST
jgi:hypothetical protein